MYLTYNNCTIFHARVPVSISYVKNIMIFNGFEMVFLMLLSRFYRNRTESERHWNIVFIITLTLWSHVGRHCARINKAIIINCIGLKAVFVQKKRKSKILSVKISKSSNPKLCLECFFTNKIIFIIYIIFIKKQYILKLKVVILNNFTSISYHYIYLEKYHTIYAGSQCSKCIISVPNLCVLLRHNIRGITFRNLTIIFFIISE